MRTFRFYLVLVSRAILVLVSVFVNENNTKWGRISLDARTPRLHPMQAAASDARVLPPFVSPDVALDRRVHRRRRRTAELPRKLAWIGDGADHPELGQAVRVGNDTKMCQLRATVATPHLQTEQPTPNAQYTIIGVRDIIDIPHFLDWGTVAPLFKLKRWRISCHLLSTEAICGD